ncbi:unnamed protein product [Rhodiola kirilowii]
MGKTLDALLKRSTLKSSKFKPLVNLALHRLAVLKNQRQVRCNLAKSDVVEILKLGLHDRALLRVEHVIKEQNMLDVLLMVEGYLDLVIERFHLIEHDKICPEELKEAISSLIYAASRCGEFPELQEIRGVFTLHYGKEFVARATELRNNCGVSTTLIQKFSTRMPSLEIRTCVVKQIAEENGITFQLSNSSDEKQAETEPAVSHVTSPKIEVDRVVDRERYFGSGKATKYENAADAAQAAFESAAYAAEAARAAVELSRGDSNDSEGSNFPRRGNSSEKTVNKNVASMEENITSFEGVAEAQTGLMKSMSMSSDSTESLDSDATDDAPKHVNQTDEMDHDAAPNDPLMGSTRYDADDKTKFANSQNMSILLETDDKTKAANSEDMSISEDYVNQAPDESWIRRGWNSNKEKLKRPFSHRSKGIVSR